MSLSSNHRHRRTDERRYLVTNQAAFRLFALKTVMARSAPPCPRNWAPEELTVAKVNSMPASLSRTMVAYPEGHGVRWKGYEFPEHVVAPEKFPFLQLRIPFSPLTVHPPDRNSKYFAEMPSNTRGIKQRSKNKFLNLLIVLTVSNYTILSRFLDHLFANIKRAFFLTSERYVLFKEEKLL